MINIHEQYMFRCLELAAKGLGTVAPNPMVGAVLVHNNQIIGEGYHQQYGEHHAEVNCLNAVAANNKILIPESILYVSLEPCAHHGKTPPCANLIIEKGIKKVVVGCRDPFNEVNGKGIEKLLAAGIEVVEGVLETACKNINKRFFTFHQQQRPYIILKWAETANRKMATLGDERLLISNAITNQLVHRWRSEEAAILIGSNTALKDNPSLTNRHWIGKSPSRLLIDTSLKLPISLNLFSDGAPLIVYNFKKNAEIGAVQYKMIDSQKNVLLQIVEDAYNVGLQSIIVEGGAILLQSFIDASIWDEARIICNTKLTVPVGLDAPYLTNAEETNRFQILNDQIVELKKINNLIN